jgi:DNA primase
MARIPESVIEDIRNRANIVDVIGDDLLLKPAGSNMKALSPFTNEKTPSFVVSPQKQIFKCFSTGKGGNVYSYLMEMHGMSFIEAVKLLAERYNISLKDYDDRQDSKSDDIRGMALQAMDDLADYYKKYLFSNEGKLAQEYIRQRQLLRKSVDAFLLGYAPDDWNSAYKYMSSLGYSDDVLVATGGFSDSKRGGLFDKFRGRLIFPIRNYLGKVIGFGGRDLSGKDNTAKYLNSPQTEIYNKSRVLYGLDLAKNSMRSIGEVIITEGYMDVISLHEAGFDNTVSTSGTSLTEEMIKLIKRYCNKAYLVFDNDKAGINAAMRTLPLLIKNDIETKIIGLEDGEDPDSIIRKKGKFSFDLYLQKGLTPVRFLHNTHKQRELLDSPASKIKAAKQSTELLDAVNDPITRDVYLNEIASLYGIARDAIGAGYDNIVSKNDNYSSDSRDDLLRVASYNEPQTKESLISRLSRSDKFILTLALESYELLEKLQTETNLHSEIFSCDEAATFFDNIVNCSGNSNPLDSLLLSDECEQVYKDAAAELAISTLSVSPNWTERGVSIPEYVSHVKDTAIVIKQLLIKSLQKEKTELIGLLKNGISDNEKSIRLLDRIGEIDRLKNQYHTEISEELK